MLDRPVSSNSRSAVFRPMKSINFGSSADTDIDKLHKRNSTFSINQLRNWNYSSSTVGSAHFEVINCKQNNYGFLSLYGLNVPRKPERECTSPPDPFTFHKMPLPPIPDNFSEEEKYRNNTRSAQKYEFRAMATKGFVVQQKSLEAEINLFLTESEALGLRKTDFWVKLKAKFKQVPRFAEECHYIYTTMAFQNSMSIFLFNLGKTFLGAPFSPMRICRFDENFREVRNGHEFSMSLVADLDISYSKIKGDMLSLKETSALYQSATKRALSIETIFTRMLKRYGYNSKLGTMHIIPLLNFYDECRLVFMDTNCARSMDEWMGFLFEVNMTFNSAEKLYKKTKQNQASASRKYEASVQVKKTLRQTMRDPDQLISLE